MEISKANRCVIVGGADIGGYARIRSYLRDDDYIIYCDSGLRHAEELGREPSLIVGDFDSHENPHSDIETIVLPVAKDDTDTVYAIREGRRRGFTDFLLVGVFGARMDHTLVNVYALFDLEEKGCTALAVDDYSEISVIPEGGTAAVDGKYPYFSLLNMTGVARGISIRGAKFPLEDGEITSGYQYATSNEVLPGETALIRIREGRLLLIKDFA
jgi:thiamine pyrophosphokinase